MNQNTLPIRQLPNAPESEMTLIGGLILEPSLLADVGDILKSADDFDTERNRAIYQALKDTYAKHGECFLDALVTALRDRGQLELAGGHEYLEQLTTSVPGPAACVPAANIVAEKARARRLAIAASRVYIDACNGSDPDSLATSLSAAIADASASDRDAFSRLADAADDVVADIDAGIRHTDPIGLRQFDEFFGGIPKVGVVTLLGIPGSGKSSLALHIALQRAKAGHGVLIFSYEMSAQTIAANALAMLAPSNVSGALRQTHTLTDASRDDIERARLTLGAINIDVCDDCLTAEGIWQRAMRAKRRGVDCIIVDYIQNLPADNHKLEATARIETGCRIMQRIARSLNMLVVMVSQVDKSAARGGQPPGQNDGIGSIAIGQVSDMMVSVHRPCLFETPDNYGGQQDGMTWEEWKQHALLTVCKNKRGPLGAAEVTFVPEWTRFEDARIQPNDLPMGNTT